MPTPPQTPIHLFQSQPFRPDSVSSKANVVPEEQSALRKAVGSNFPSKHYAAEPSRFSALGIWYRRVLTNHPFLVFGFPFIGLMIAGSFFLTPATAVRFEKFDRKTHMLDRDEALGLGRKREGVKKRGRRDIREEYWRLAGREGELDDWEPKRVKRLPGEPDGTFD